MNTTARSVTSIPRITHDEAMTITEVENRRFADQLASLSAEDWARPTDCPRWSVQDIAAHLVGSAATQASPREFVRQVRQGRRFLADIDDAQWWDGMNELQVVERRSMTAAELVAAWGQTSSRALASRRKLPRPIARLPLLSLPEPVGRQPVSYLFDVGFTRDVWMHRVDIAVATGRELVADAAHDGRSVEDIVAEWATTTASRSTSC